MAELDVVIIGAGHNGLICAAYLAMAGLKVKVVERRKVVGGAAVTEEFHPGFRNSVAAYTVSLLNPKVIADLELPSTACGSSSAARRISCPRGRPLSAHRRRPHPGSDREVQRQGRRALRRLRRRARGDRRRAARSGAARAAQPRRGLGARAFSEALERARHANVLRGLSLDDKRDAARPVHHARPARSGRLVRERSGQGAVRLRRGGRQLREPLHAGLRLRAAASRFGEVNGKKGVWGHAIGGMGAITPGDGEGRARAGVEIETGAAVREVIVEGGRAVGVVLDDGRTIRARAVVVQRQSEAALHAAGAGRRAAGRIPRAHAALAQRLRHLPHERRALRAAELHRAAGRTGDHHTVRHHHRADPRLHGPRLPRRARHGWSREPIVEMLIPSTLDDTLAPKGEHVASLFCQHVAPELPDGALGRAPRRGGGPDDRRRSTAMRPASSRA